MTIPSWLSWLAAEDPNPQDFHNCAERGTSDEPPAVTQEIPVVTVHATSSTAGLAALRRGVTIGGGWRCEFGTWHGIDEACACDSPQSVLATALPEHDLMKVWASERDLFAMYRRNGAVIVPATLKTPRSAA